MIRDSVKSTTASESEKYNIIKKCLYVLKLMIQESEKKGTAHIKSHFGLQKRKILNIKVLSQNAKLNNCSVTVYGNTTMWELKEIISKKIKACVDFIKLEINKVELQDNDNGKTCIDMKVVKLILSDLNLI